MWLAVAIVFVHYGRIVDVVRYDLRVNRAAFWFANLLFATSVSSICYLAFYVPLVAKDPDPEAFAPNAVLIGTFAGLCAMVTYIMAFWPVWGLFTPVIVSCLTISTLLSVNFIPDIF